MDLDCIQRFYPNNEPVPPSHDSSYWRVVADPETNLEAFVDQLAKNGSKYVVQVSHIDRIQSFVYSPQISFIVPLCAISDSLYSQGPQIWMYINESSSLDAFELQKMVSYRHLNLYVKSLNPSLFTLLVNCKSVVVHDPSLIPPLRSMIRNVVHQYRFSSYVIEGLNPWRNDLSVDIYQQFQKDRHKYAQYHNAIELAVHDLQDKYDGGPLSVLVIGPGLGPLVESVMACLSTEETTHQNTGNNDTSTSVTSAVTVVEKNKQVEPFLRELQNKHGFTLIMADVTTLDLPPFNLVVSEMLGSFGCNELFPEILDSVPVSDIMVPSDVDSYVTLIHTTTSTTTKGPYLNTPIHYPLSHPQKLWSFSYPSTHTELNQEVFVVVEAQVTGEINALKGVFRSILYGNYQISNDDTCPHPCTSWFPMVFPVEPVAVEKGQKVDLRMQRISMADGVYYTWEVNGKKYNADGAAKISRGA